MKTLYIFPHPDDESFGPAPVIHQQLQNGEEVHLLTLTKGGATKQRFKYGYTVKQMGEVRHQEMLKVEKVLGLTSMSVLDYPDGEMREYDPRIFEQVLTDHIRKIRPEVVVTYAIHGISGHHDHLVIHAVVKRLFCELREQQEFSFWKRLALFTLPDLEEHEKQGGNANVRSSKKKYIDCIVPLSEGNQKALRGALYCYETFIDVIESTGVIEQIGDKVYFEFFDENFDIPIQSITDQLPLG